MNVVDTIVEWSKTIFQAVSDAETSIVQELWNDIKVINAIQNIGTTIVDGIKGIFDSIFSIDMDKVTEAVNLEEKLKSKFEVFYVISDKFDAFNNSIQYTSGGQSAELMSGDYSGDVLDPLAVNMQLPDWLGGQYVCILDMTEPKLLDLFAFCRTFLKFGLWLGFITHLIKFVTPKFTINS